METRTRKPPAFPTHAAPFLSRLLGTCFVARTSFLGDSSFSRQTSRRVPRLPVLFEVMSESPQKIEVQKTEGQSEKSDVVKYLLQNLNKGNLKFALLFKLKKEDLKQVETGDMNVLKSCLKNVSEGAILSEDRYQVIPRNQLYAIVEKIQKTLKTECVPEGAEIQKHLNGIAHVEECNDSDAYPVNCHSNIKPTFCNKSTQYEYVNGYSERCITAGSNGTRNHFSKSEGMESLLDECDRPLKRGSDVFHESFRNTSTKEVQTGGNDKKAYDACEIHPYVFPAADDSMIASLENQSKKLEAKKRGAEIPELCSNDSKEVKTGEHQASIQADQFRELNKLQAYFDKCNREFAQESNRLAEEVAANKEKQSTWPECSVSGSSIKYTTSDTCGCNYKQGNDNFTQNGIRSDFTVLKTSRMPNHKPSKIPIPIERSVPFQRASCNNYHARKFVPLSKERADLTCGKIQLRDSGNGIGSFRGFNTYRRDSLSENLGSLEQNDQRQLQKSEARHKTKLPVSTRMRNGLKNHIRYDVLKSLDKRQTKTGRAHNKIDADKRDKVTSSDRLSVMVETNSILTSGQLKENEIYDRKQRELVKLIAQGVERQINSASRKNAM